MSDCDDIFGDIDTTTEKKDDDMFGEISLNDEATAKSIHHQQPAEIEASAPEPSPYHPQPQHHKGSSVNGGGAAGDMSPSYTSLSERHMASSPDPATSATITSNTTKNSDIQITVSDPVKTGSGMNAFVRFLITVKVSPALTQFSKRDIEVYRRFSDFLGLHQKLVAKHLADGVIVPAPPEKDAINSTRMKMTSSGSSTSIKEDGAASSSGGGTGGLDFLEKRRATLQRYLRRIADHLVLVKDDAFVQFLETAGDLPKASNTQALSGASVLKFFGKVSDTLGKLSSKFEEPDAFFEELQLELSNLERQLVRLHASLDQFVMYRKDLANNIKAVARSCTTLANAEDHSKLASAIVRLSEVYESVGQLQDEQADTDFYSVQETTRDYINLIDSVRASLNERQRQFSAWKDAENTLAKKRQQKATFDQQGKHDKISDGDIRDLESKVDNGEYKFKQISNAIKSEMKAFNLKRVEDFKGAVITCLESMLVNQEKMIKMWEEFIPEVSAISSN